MSLIPLGWVFIGITQDIYLLTTNSCFVSDLRLLAGVVLAPMVLVMLFNIFMLVVAFRVIVQQNKKKLFQGGDRHLMKMTVRNIVSLVWLIVLFGVGWLFGLLTIREVSRMFQ